MLEISTNRIGDIMIMTLSGRVDAINCAKWQAELDTIIAAGFGHRLILQMHDINYLSAAGLRVLRTLENTIEVVRIAEPSHRVIDVMQITGLDAVYRLFETLTQAIHDTMPVLNAHTHLELGWLNGGLPDITGADFVPWMKNTIKDPFQKLTSGWEQKFTEAIEAGIQALTDAGVTAIGDISETGLSIQPLLNSGMTGIVYIEVTGVDPSQADVQFQKMVDLIEKWEPKMQGRLKLGIAPHTPYSVSRALWEKVLPYAKKKHLPLCIHVAESAAETQYLHDGTGDLKTIYYPEHDFEPPKKSPVAYLEELGALELQPLLIHAVQVDDKDIALIKKYGCTVVHCPRSNIRLRCGRMPLEKFLHAGIPVLMGTDSLVSSPSLDIFDEIEFASALHYGKVNAAHFVKMVHGQLPSVG